MNQSIRLRYANIIVGLFTLGVLFLMVVLIALAFRRGEYQTYEFFVTEREAGDLFQGAEVWMLGERAGSVTSLTYVGQSNRVRIEIAIKLSLVDQMKNVEVHLERKFGVGTPLLRIRRRNATSTDETSSITPIGFGPPTLMRPIVFRPDPLFPEPMQQSAAPAPSDPARKPSSRPSQDENADADRDADRDDVITLDVGNGDMTFVGENDRLSDISTQVKRVADSVNAIRGRALPTLDNISESSRDVSSASKSFRDASEQLRPETSQTLRKIRSAADDFQNDIETVTGTINEVVENEIRTAVDQVRQSAIATSKASQQAETAAQQAALAAASVNETSVQTGQQIETTLSDLRETSSEIRRLVRETLEVVRIVRDEAEDLPGTTERVNDAVGDTQDLVEQIQDHWLLRKGRRKDSSPAGISPSSLRIGGGG